VSHRVSFTDTAVVELLDSELANEQWHTHTHS